MKKLALGVMAIAALLLTGLPATEVEAKAPSCSYQAVVTATHNTCGVVNHSTSGWDMAGCQAKVAGLINLLNSDPVWSNPVVTTQCHVVGVCPK